MSQVNVEQDDIGRLLEGAAKVTERVRYCWLLTEGEKGGTARPMGRILSRSDADRWTIRFVTEDRKSTRLDSSHQHRSRMPSSA